MLCTIRGIIGHAVHVEQMLAQLAESGDGLAVNVGEQELPIPAETVAERPGLRAYAGRTIGLGIRPEHLREAIRLDEADRVALARAASMHQGGGPPEVSRHLNVDP